VFSDCYERTKSFFLSRNPHILRNLKVHYCVRHLFLGSTSQVLSNLNPVRTHTHRPFNVHFNIAASSPLGSYEWSFTFRFSNMGLHTSHIFHKTICCIQMSSIWSHLQRLLRGMGYEGYNWTHNTEGCQCDISTASIDVRNTGSHASKKFPIFSQGNTTTNMISYNSTDWHPKRVSLRLVRFAADMQKHSKIRCVYGWIIG
jgi:hypothetical protein